MVRSSRKTAGTVEHAAMPLTSWAASSPRKVRASSSAVLRASVFVRHDCASLSPSNTPMTVFVLPMSMASSTVIRPYSKSQLDSDIVDEPGAPDPRRDQQPGRSVLGDLAQLGVAQLEVVDGDAGRSGQHLGGGGDDAERAA